MLRPGPGEGRAGGSDGGNKLAAVEIDQSTACSLDGMLLADYPGPKVQMHYAGVAQPDWFCDTIEMFNVYLNPEQARAAVARLQHRVAFQHIQAVCDADLIWLFL